MSDPREIGNENIDAAIEMCRSMAAVSGEWAVYYIAALRAARAENERLR